MRRMSPVRHGRFALALAALLALALLVGCGGGDEDSTTGESTTTTATSPGGAEEGSEAGTADGDTSQATDTDEPSDGGGSSAADGSGTDSNSANSGQGDGSPPAILRKAKEFGSEASGSEAEEAEAVLLAYLEAQAAGEWSTACSYLAKELRRFDAKIARGAPGGSEGCPGFVEGVTERLSPSERSSLTDIDVVSVRIEGESGFITYIAGTGAETAKPIQEEAGEWKLSSLLATLLAQARSQESP
jgi:hypothetical protein